MFKNNFWTSPQKSPSEMFKPNATMITKTTDERNQLDS